MKLKHKKIPYLFIAGCAALAVVLYFSISFLMLNGTSASTNIDAINHWAWNDGIGWIDLYYSNNVVVSANDIEGFASSTVGSVSFNCNSTPGGDICSGPSGNWKVSNDGNGNLTGWAWNDTIGWISFDSGTAGSPYAYQVIINPATGMFGGWAWNDAVGWISFNCVDSGSCSSSDYKVQTSWSSTPVIGYLYSSIFDTQVTGGASINSVMWKGQLNGGSVSFQIASSNNSGGPWDYLGPGGTSSSSDVYSGNPDVVIPVSLTFHNNQRYVRYKAIIESDMAQTQTPVIENIIINWGP